jgi:hypothetical protein
MNKKKRYRMPKVKDNELKLQWGKLPKDEPDICVLLGKDIPKCDSRLLMNSFSSKRFHPNSFEFEDSFLEELEKRGYDIETIKFSIKKKQGFLND